ncbi:protein phosphatase 1 regulatory subunit 3C-B [Triplophysa rosa]|uniref:Protein phosphatase 1 regulatory subunit 3C n=1 Tax=Triplophysa rosa TaxID=992332 RepID=A0A9W7WF20_TRIRA|nr:protein phosphatase 1 regulatory subunit 3C-B [Triplophysa rosa]KAI7796729.1 protein phosphatase 1 regulatory subunit 3C-B [Triplophysa rosa]
MNCTRVLHILNPRPMPGPIMPVDVAMRICLAHSPPLHSFLSSYEDYKSRILVNQYKPLRSCISSRTEVDTANLEWKSPKTKAKKKVVFADSKGMSLTAVHVFKEFEEDVLDLQFELSDLENAIVGMKVEKDKSFALDFPQPAADYLDFRNRLKKNLVCLENCIIQERLLTGTVKVSNVSFEKAVNARITFDSWKSYTDNPCTFMNNVYGCEDVDTFSFSIDLPSFVHQDEQVEFCISYRTHEMTHWDNNDGKNYKLVRAENEPGQSNRVVQKTTDLKNQAKRPEMEFDQFGSPRTSSGFFPEWQSLGHIGNNTPYW